MRKNINLNKSIYIVLLSFFILSLSLIKKAITQYEQLPDRFESRIASSSDEWLGVYSLQPNKFYNGFKFFIPPGTIAISFRFISRSVAMGGPQIYLSSRLGGAPTANRTEFQNLEENLPNVNYASQSVAVKDLQIQKGFMAKRTQVSGDRVWVVSDTSSAELLPDSYKKNGQWVYVNLLDKNGYDTIEILSVTGRIKVDPAIYNAWIEYKYSPQERLKGPLNLIIK